jgi:hypothetical protein
LSLRVDLNWLFSGFYIEPPEAGQSLAGRDDCILLIKMDMFEADTFAERLKALATGLHI